MKFTPLIKILILTTIAVVLVAGVTLFLQSKHRLISEPTVALLFLSKDSALNSNVIQIWQKKGIAANLVNACESVQGNSLVSCLGKYVSKLAEAAESSNAQLVVIGEEPYSNSLLQAFEKFDLSAVAEVRADSFSLAL